MAVVSGQRSCLMAGRFDLVTLDLERGSFRENKTTKSNEREYGKASSLTHFAKERYMIFRLPNAEKNV